MLYPIIEVLIVDALLFLLAVCDMLDDDNGKEGADGGDDVLSNGSTPASADAALAEVDSFEVAFGEVT
jgi:hypothetical protein